MILSADAEQAFDRTQHPFRIKTPNTVGAEGTFLDTVRAGDAKPTAHIGPDSENRRASPAGSGVDREATPIQQHKSQPQQPGMERKSHTISSANGLVSTENPKDATKNLSELITEFSKFSGCEINTQKSVVFLHTNNECSEKRRK